MMEQVPDGNERIGRLELAVTDLSARVGRLEVLVERILTDIAELKVDMKDLRKQADTNFRVLAGMITALGLGMGAVMAKGFGWL
jgi:hypothetical protein